MYDAYYDEYMRNILGYGSMPEYRNLYSMIPQDLYNTNTYCTDEQSKEQMIEELEEYYPNIYKVVYPMVQKACVKNSKPLTKNLIDEIVNEIYMRVEQSDQININVDVGNTSKINNYSSDREVKGVHLNKSPEIKSEVRETRGEKHQKETRQRNYLLNDLIRILVLRELLERPGRPGGNRPPQRPPMIPPYPGMRPPIRPRSEFNYEYGF